MYKVVSDLRLFIVNIGVIREFFAYIKNVN